MTKGEKSGKHYSYWLVEGKREVWYFFKGKIIIKII